MNCNYTIKHVKLVMCLLMVNKVFHSLLTAMVIIKCYQTLDTNSKLVCVHLKTHSSISSALTHCWRVFLVYVCSSRKYE